MFELLRSHVVCSNQFQTLGLVVNEFVFPARPFVETQSRPLAGSPNLNQVARVQHQVGFAQFVRPPPQVELGLRPKQNRSVGVIVVRLRGRAVGPQVAAFLVVALLGRRLLLFQVGKTGIPSLELLEKSLFLSTVSSELFEWMALLWRGTLALLIEITRVPASGPLLN